MLMLTCRNVILLYALTLIIPMQIGCSAERSGISAQPDTGFGAEPLPDGSQLRRDPANGTITYLKGENLGGLLRNDAEFSKFQKENRYGDIVLFFLGHYRRLFGLSDPFSELAVTAVETDELGMTHVKLGQRYSGLAVWGAELIVHLNRNNQIYRVGGHYIPTPASLPLRPALDGEAALRISGERLAGDPDACRHRCPSELLIFPSGQGQPRLAYRVVYKPRLDEGWELFVDAQNGEVLEKLSTVRTGGIRFDAVMPALQMKRKNNDETTRGPFEETPGELRD
jgi:hypothetical protein